MTSSAIALNKDIPLLKSDVGQGCASDYYYGRQEKEKGVEGTSHNLDNREVFEGCDVFQEINFIIEINSR